MNLSNLTSASEVARYNLTEYNILNDIIQNQVVQALFCMVYTCIFVLGVFGNVLVCYVVGRNRAMQTVTNLFISNLALSDILLCILCVPFTPLYTFLGSWIFGSTLCHVVAFAQGTSVYISTLTLTSIAVDRFFVIVYPFKPRMKLATCAIIISCIWLFSVMVTLPYGIYTVLRADRRAFYCEEHWPSERVRQVYGGLTATLQFVLPFFIVTFCYVNVSLKLNDRARAKPGSKNSRREEADRDRKRRTNRMLIAMVTIFGVSWMPLTIVNLTNDLYMSTGRWEYFNLSFFVVHALAMSSTCYNPFLYAWLNENFRKEFKLVLPCFDRAALLAGGQRGGSNRAGGGGGGATTAGGGASGRSYGGGGGGGGWKSERTTCNGNETLDSVLLTSAVHCRSTSVRRPTASSIPEEFEPPPAGDAEGGAAASYSAMADEVHLHLGPGLHKPDVPPGVLLESL
ncbi:prolactin-releasing peptide receptor-like [Schistocerca gregaria]|uniref:prolactin-releasing peptide receptor-like n=1 Tax=Schistocerca gregaria TaxID=7010 RepID=UPI00211EDF52|nr:prolactin-releasing peptide receptor-like [Schistocerca gregaria]